MMTWWAVWMALMRSERAMIAFCPVSSEEVRVGTVSVFSWKTKQERRETISEGV
jgi:hypothetical protein